MSMPPPNHQHRFFASLVATKQRTFMCAVGQYGLRGCRTSETPIASQERPASCGTDGGGRGGQGFAGDMREIDTAALEERGLPRSAATGRRRLPGDPERVGAEALAVEGFEFADNAASAGR